MRWTALAALAIVACDYPRPTRLHADAPIVPPDQPLDAPSCTWAKLMPTNFDYTALPAQGPAWTIAAGPAATYYTANGTGNGSPPTSVVLPSGARLVYVSSFTVPSGTMLIIDGDPNTTSSMPLVIVADTIAVDGTIAMRSHAPSCTNVVGNICADNGGGGGGSFGGSGGSGGMSFDESGGAASTPSGGQTLSPLQAGCSGGASRAAPNSNLGGANGGPAGGALQLSAQYSLTISGYIDANGLGGSAGSGEVTSACGTTGSSTGGGGGGAGGAVLLESCSITISNVGSVCANGGAGGSGGDGNPASNGRTGGNGNCTAAAAGGAETDSSSHNRGGAGGFGASLDGINGGPGDSNASGGGGGGGAGRIRLHAPTKLIDASAVVSPPAYLN